FLDRIFFFVQCRAKRAKPDGPAIEFFYYRHQKLSVHFIEPERIDLHAIQRIVRNGLVNAAVVVDLGIIAYAAKQTVRDARCSARTACNFVRSGSVDRYVQDTGRTCNDAFKFFDAVKIQMKYYAEPAAQRCGYQAR